MKCNLLIVCKYITRYTVHSSLLAVLKKHISKAVFQMSWYCWRPLAPVEEWTSILLYTSNLNTRSSEACQRQLRRSRRLVQVQHSRCLLSLCQRCHFRMETRVSEWTDIRYIPTERVHFLPELQEAAVGAVLEFVLLKTDVQSCRKLSLFSYCSPPLLWSFPRLRVSHLYLTCNFPLINEMYLFYFII